MKENRSDFQDSSRSPMMETAFADAAGSPHMKIATCISLYLVLAILWLPGFSFGGLDIPRSLTQEPKPRYVVIKPPPEKPLETTVTQERKARKQPMPDATPNEPEPVIEPDPLEAPEVLASDDWEIGIPEHTPEEPTLIMDGMPEVESPVITKRVKPSYPEKGLKIRLQGYVILQAVLRKDGTVGDIKVIRGLGKGKFGFEEEAIKSLRNWEFIPGKFRDKPADIVLNLRVAFNLG